MPTSVYRVTALTKLLVCSLPLAQPAVARHVERARELEQKYRNDAKAPMQLICTTPGPMVAVPGRASTEGGAKRNVTASLLDVRYTKIMEKSLAQGPKYAADEIVRVMKILEGKAFGMCCVPALCSIAFSPHPCATTCLHQVHPQKRAELSDKLKVLPPSCAWKTVTLPLTS